MADNIVSGAEAGVSYAFESIAEFNKTPDNHTESDETYVAFGRNVEVSISRNQNKERVYSVGERNAEATVDKQYSGTATIGGTLSNAYWLLGIMGANTDGGTTGAYTHTYTEANRQPTMTIKRAISFGDTEGTENLLGGVITTATITAAVGEAVKFSMEIPYRVETAPDEVSTIAYVVDSEDIFTFAGATIEAPDSSVLASIENFEIVFNNNAELTYGLSSRYAEAVVSKNREYNVSYTTRISDYVQMKAFLLSTEVATLTINFENNSGDTLVLSFAEFHMNEDNLPTNPAEIIKEDCTGWVHSCTTAVYTNDTQTAPAEAS